MMKKFAPFIIFIAGFVFLGMIYFDNNGLKEVTSLKETLENQEQVNYALIKEIRDYKKELRGIQNSNRELEKVIKNEYALGKQDEIIVVFKEK